jgi:hypothetical protein
MADAAQKKSADLEQETQSLRALAEDLWVHRGTLLLSTATWSPPFSAADVVRDAKALKNELDAIDGQIDSVKQQSRSGIGGLMAKAADWNKQRKLAAERDRIAAALQPLVIQVAQQAPEVTVPAADVIASQARSADTQTQEVASRAAESATVAAGLSAELQRRTDAEHDMGFDSLYLAAYLNSYGPHVVESPLVLKRGEQASVSAPAVLSRQQIRDGGSVVVRASPSQLATPAFVIEWVPSTVTRWSSSSLAGSMQEAWW